MARAENPDAYNELPSRDRQPLGIDPASHQLISGFLRLPVSKDLSDKVWKPQPLEGEAVTPQQFRERLAAIVQGLSMQRRS